MIIYTQKTPDWNAIYARLNEYAALFDHRREISSIRLLNETHTAALEPETALLVRTALDIAASSGGAFDPTILPLTRLWNLEGESFTSEAVSWRPPSAEELTAARKLVDYHQLTIDMENRATLPPGFSLELGGIAKGAIVDRLADYLNTLGYTHFLIEAGGDILVSGSKLEPVSQWLPWKTQNRPWVVAIQHPRDAGAYLASIQLDSSHSRLSLVTSGDYERFVIIDGIRYHHLIDPATGYPARENISVTVLAPNCTTADGLSTAAFVLGFQAGRKYLESLDGIEGLLIREQEGHLETAETSAFPVAAKDLEL